MVWLELATREHVTPSTRPAILRLAQKPSFPHHADESIRRTSVLLRPRPHREFVMSAFDLPAYLARIAYSGRLEPDRATLAGLLAAHMASIHFENIDVLLGRPIRLDVEGLQDKIVRGRRGGYCFEQATLFDAALRTLGFNTTLRTARVTLVLAPDKAPRGHMIGGRPARGKFHR